MIWYSHGGRTRLTSTEPWGLHIWHAMVIEVWVHNVDILLRFWEVTSVPIKRGSMDSITFQFANESIRIYIKHFSYLSTKNTNGVLLVVEALKYLVDKLKNGHTRGVILSKAILVVIEDIEFVRNSESLEWESLDLKLLRNMIKMEMVCS